MNASQEWKLLWFHVHYEVSATKGSSFVLISVREDMNIKCFDNAHTELYVFHILGNLSISYTECG